jgi:hypothetical protein
MCHKGFLQYYIVAWQSSVLPTRSSRLSQSLEEQTSRKYRADHGLLLSMAPRTSPAKFDLNFMMFQTSALKGYQNKEENHNHKGQNVASS